MEKTLTFSFFPPLIVSINISTFEFFSLFQNFFPFLSAVDNALNDRLNKRFCELSRLSTNIECIDQLMDLLRVQNSMDEILTLISQVSSSQVHAKVAELLQTLLNVSSAFLQ